MKKIALLASIAVVIVILFTGASIALLRRGIAPSADVQATPIQAQDLSPFFKNTVGAFVLYDSKSDHYIRYNEARGLQRFSPKSTFKIPNSLIGLETGVIRDAEFVIPWNRQKYPPDNWNQEPFVHWAQDHTLRSAIKYSVVWYYRELALRVGQQKMKQYVTRFNYGNKAVSGRIDNSGSMAL